MERPLTDKFSFGMRLDLLVEIIKGEYAGSVVIVDHKFVYDFYSADSLTMDAQLPKYVAASWFNNFDVKYALLNQLRHRETKENKLDISKKFQRTFVPMSKTRVQNVMREQIMASERIVERKQLPLEVYGKTAIRTMGQMTCGQCPYVDICSAQLEGQDISLLLATEYKENTYGYASEDRD
jgi:hypothetical protein